MKFDLDKWLEGSNLFSIFIFLFFLSVIVYANTVLHPFVHDDVGFIVTDPSISDWRNIASLFSHPSAYFKVTAIAQDYYRPLLEIFYKVQYVFFHINPIPYHIFNIILHTINSLLVFKILTLLLNDKLKSLFVAVIFLLHPAQTEAVAYYSGISDLLCAFFCFSGYTAFILSIKKEIKRMKNTFYTLSLFLFFTSLFIKESAIIFLPLIILYESCFPEINRGYLKEKLLRLSGFLWIVLGYFTLRAFILESSLQTILKHRDELILRVLSIPGIILQYVKILVLPIDLHFYRTTDILKPHTMPFIIFILIFIALIAVIRSFPRKERCLLFFSTGWFILTLLPALNIIPMVVEYSFIWTPDHFLYLPLVGFFLFLSVVLMRYLELFVFERKDPIFLTSGLAVSIIFLPMTMNQNTYWKGEIPLFERSRSFEKDLGRVRCLLGDAYYANREYDKAKAEYLVSFAIVQGYYRKNLEQSTKQYYGTFLRDLHVKLAQCYEAQNHLSNSIEEYQQALSLNSNDSSSLYNNLGMVYVKLNAMDEAVLNFKNAVVHNPQNLAALSNLAVCYIAKKNFDEAEILLRQVLAKDEQFLAAKQNLRKLLQEKGSKISPN